MSVRRSHMDCTTTMCLMGDPSPCMLFDPPPQPHDGRTVHPELTPALAQILRNMNENLAICVLDHPDDERLAKVEGSLRWLLGKRV